MVLNGIDNGKLSSIMELLVEVPGLHGALREEYIQYEQYYR